MSVIWSRCSEKKYTAKAWTMSGNPSLDNLVLLIPPWKYSGDSRRASPKRFGAIIAAKKGCYLLGTEADSTKCASCPKCALLTVLLWVVSYWDNGFDLSGFWEGSRLPWSSRTRGDIKSPWNFTKKPEFGSRARVILGPDGKFAW